MSEPGDGSDRPNNRPASGGAGAPSQPAVRANWRGLRFEGEEPPPGRARRGAANLFHGLGIVAVALGLRRGVNADGELEPRNRKALWLTIGTVVVVVFVWTSVHVVPPGNVAVPVTLGSPGEHIGSGIHITWPFTQTKNMSVRTEQYSMTAAPGEGTGADDSVTVLGRDGGSAKIDATVLYQLDASRATDVYTNLGTNLVAKLIRPSARSCIRSQFTDYNMVDAATASWQAVEDKVTTCMADKLESRGIALRDFQLREVSLGEQIQKSIDAKVAAQQNVEKLQYDFSAAQEMADIKRTDASATADAQSILKCGWHTETAERNGRQVTAVVANGTESCTDGNGLTPEYLQLQYILALQNLVTSQNASTIIMPFDQSLTPLINVGPGSTTVAPQSDSGASDAGSSTPKP
jgi:membrane protease subunit HflK